MIKRSLLLMTMAAIALPSYATVFGVLDNFDVVNDTGTTAHGFEIDLHDTHASDITSIFGAADRWPGMERYGAPTVTEYDDASGFGVRVVYQATNTGNGWSAGTPSGTLPVSPSDSCWPYGAPNYGPDYPCDHFGITTLGNTPNVTYSWLVEDANNPNVLTRVAAMVPNPVWTVTPPVVVPGVVPPPPQVNVVIAAPQPIDSDFGDPRWVKVSATGSLEELAIEDLVAENAIIKKARTQVQIEWQLLQTEVGDPGSGQIDLSGVQLDEGAKGVVYRFEFYEYTGARSVNNHARPVNGEMGTPDAGDIGKFLVAQNAGINFDGNVAPPPQQPLPPVFDAVFTAAILGTPYSQWVSATPGNDGDVLQISVTGLPAGLMFDSVTNIIGGVPTEVGAFELNVTLLDLTNLTSASATTILEVAEAPLVFDLVFGQGTVGAAFSQKLSVLGGYAPYTFVVSGNALPAGLILSGDTMSGVPSVAGSTDVTFEVTDAVGSIQSATATLTINPPPPIVIGTINLPAGTVGSGYTGKVSANGGVGTLVWSGNGLPPGLTIAKAGTVSGTPTTAGTFAVTLTATDALGTKKSVGASISISTAVAGGSCTVPAGAKTGLNNQGMITVIGGSVVTFKTSKGSLVSVNVPACAKIEWNGGAKAFAIGQQFEWNGYSTVALGNVATQVTIN